MTYILLITALTTNAFANILIKLGSKQFSEGLGVVFKDPLLFFKNGYFFGGVLLFAVTLVLYSLVLSRMNLSVAYPIMTSLGFLIVVGFSVWALHEQLYWWQFVGIGLIIFGVILLSQGAIN